jgi:hypothetical protein
MLTEHAKEKKLRERQPQEKEKKTEQVTRNCRTKKIT